MTRGTGRGFRSGPLEEWSAFTLQCLHFSPQGDGEFSKTSPLNGTLGSQERSATACYQPHSSTRDSSRDQLPLTSQSRVVRRLGRPNRNSKSLVHKPPEPHIVHEPQHQKHGQRIRATCTHQWQRNARHRHTPNDHSHVHQNVKQQQSTNSHADVSARPVRGGLCILNDLHQQQEIQP